MCTPLGYSVDVVISLIDGREVGVEVDGPGHFFGEVPTGATVLKRRQLRAAGWTLLPLPYWEWNALADPPAKEDYLLRALQQMEEQREEQMEEKREEQLEEQREEQMGEVPPPAQEKDPLKFAYPLDEGLSA